MNQHYNRKVTNTIPTHNATSDLLLIVPASSESEAPLANAGLTTWLDEADVGVVGVFVGAVVVMGEVIVGEVTLYSEDTIVVELWNVLVELDAAVWVTLHWALGIPTPMINDTSSAASDDSAAWRLDSCNWRMEMLVVTADAALASGAQIPVLVGDGTGAEVIFVQMKGWWCCNNVLVPRENAEGVSVTHCRCAGF